MSDSTPVSAGTGKASWDWGMPGGSPPARSSAVRFTPGKILCQPLHLWPTPVDWVLGGMRRSALTGANPLMLDDGCYCVSVHWLCIPFFFSFKFFITLIFVVVAIAKNCFFTYIFIWVHFYFSNKLCSSFWCSLAETGQWQWRFLQNFAVVCCCVVV